MSQPMYRGGRPPAPGGAVGVLTALALFAVICGLLLLLAGGSSSSQGPTPEQARHQRMVNATKAAARAGKQARGAIDGANYGAAKKIIEDLQREVIRLQVELEATKPAGQRPPAGK